MLEPLSAPIESIVSELLGAGEERLVCAVTDLGVDDSFGEQWVVVTPTRLLVVASDRAPVQVPITEIVRCHTEPLVGGGRLVVERRDQPPVRVAFSQTQAAKFSEVARGLEQLRENDTFHINTHIDRTRCEKCRRLLPEKDGICPACIQKADSIKRIGRYLLPHKTRAVLLALSSAVVTAAELAPPLVTLRIVDDVLIPASGSTLSMEERAGLLGLLVLALVGIRVFSWCAEWVHGWTMTWLGAQVTAEIRAELYHRLEMLSLEFYDKRQIGTLISRATRDVQMLQNFLIDGLPYLVVNVLMVVGILGFLLVMSWSLSLYVLLPVPLVLIWSIFFWGRLRGLFTRLSQSWAKLTERTVEALSGIRVVKAFAQESREVSSFGVANRRIRDIAVKTGVNEGIFFATMTFLTGIGMLIVWLIGGQQVLGGAMTLGTLLAVYSYMWLFYGPLEWFGQVNDQMSRAFAGAERIFEVIDTQPESAMRAKPIPLKHMQGHIRFRDVTFGYDKSKPVLRGIDLDLEPGTMVGLVGKSGVGKTTIVNLIARFYDADHGAIEIDGIDVRDLDLNDLRSQIGIVLQEPMLFSGTIADNIGYGKPDATLRQIMAAARTANAHNFIMAKPDGYEMKVGEKGTGLSGGERQRVSIARAILRDPRILIFDEATASVDVETEEKIQEALERLTAGRTTIAIAHRLSTLRGANRIVVLDEGKIAEEGSHAELMARKGQFFELVQVQKAVSEIIAIKD